MYVDFAPWNGDVIRIVDECVMYAICFRLPVSHGTWCQQLQQPLVGKWFCPSRLTTGMTLISVWASLKPERLRQNQMSFPSLNQRCQLPRQQRQQHHRQCWTRGRKVFSMMTSTTFCEQILMDDFLFCNCWLHFHVTTTMQSVQMTLEGRGPVPGVLHGTCGQRGDY